jgi:DNA-binding transcriptional MerR regulator
MSKLPVTEPASAPAVPQGRYRIATVAELTGVSEPTLRAWERRYGIPCPERTPAGYRLYGDEDIRLVKEMRRLSEEGIAVAEAARVLLSRSSHSSPGVDAAAVDPTRSGFELAVDALLDAVDRFDDVALDEQLRRLLFLGSAIELLDRVLAPALKAVGERWHAGELSVAQEHLASQKVGTVMRNLARLLPGADAEDGAVLACFADEDHELGLLGVAIRVSDWGLRPLFLGARTPPSALRSAVEAASPKFVALSVTMTPARPRARELVDDYAAACGGVPWVVGGSGADPIGDLIEKRGGLVVREQGPAIEAALRRWGGLSPSRQPRRRTVPRA